MAVVGSAEVLIRPSFKGMGKAAEKAGISAGRRAGSSLTSRMGAQVSKWAKRGLLAGGVAAGATFVAGVKSGLDQQASQLVLTGLYDNADLAQETMRELNKVVKDSPLGANAFYKGAESLAYTGLQGEAAVKVLENVGNVIVGAGGTEEAMSSFTEAMLSGVNRGKFSMMELNRISGAGVPIYDALAEHIGVSSAEIQEMASKGQIGMEDVVTVLEKADSQFFKLGLSAGELAKQSLPNQMKRFWGEITTTLGEKFQPVLAWVQEWFAGFTSEIGPKFTSFLDRAEAGISAFVQGWKDGEGPGGKFREILTNVRDAAQDLWAVFTNRVLPALKSIGSWLTDNPGKIKAVVGAFVAWRVALAGIRLGVFVVDLAKVTAGVVKQTAAVLANVAAWVASKVETAALAGMLATDWLVQQAKSLAGWVRETAAIVAHKAAQMASTVATKAAAVATNAMAVAQRALNAVMKANPIGIVITVITALVAAFVTAYKRSEKFREIVDTAWNGIKKAAEVVWNFLSKWVFKPLGAAFKATWEAAKTAAQFMSNAWNAVKDAFSYVWNWIKLKVFRPFQLGVEVLRRDFQEKIDRVKDIWGGVKSAFKKPWDWIKTNVFDRFKDGLSNLRDHVRTIRESIGNAWRGIANKFRTPINWVLDKVWNNGIAKAFNSAASALNLKTRLSVEAAIPAFAKGGLARKGWALVGEEGPELVNFSNPGRVYTAKETAEALSLTNAPDAAGHTDSLPMGGGIGSRMWEGVKGAAGAVTGWVRGGMAAAADLILSPIRKLIAPTVSQWGTVGQFAGGAITSSLDSLVKWIRGKDDVGTAGGIQDDISGGLWRRPSRGMVTSRYGPRSLLGMNFHAGVDYAGGPYSYAAAAGKVFKTGWNILPHRSGIGIGIDHGGGVFTYYGHNPNMSAIKVRPGDMVRAGQHIGREGATGNVTGPHLHFETHRGGWGRHVNPSSFGIFDQGGLLKPGMLAYHSARMSKPDAVLTARQWDDIHRLAAGGGGDTYNVTFEVDMDDVGDVQRLVHTFRELPRMARQKRGVR